MTEYRQDDRANEGYCPQCGEPLSAMTTGARGFCEVHGWQWCDWYAHARPSDRDPGDETDDPNLIPGVMTGEENDR